MTEEQDKYKITKILLIAHARAKDMAKEQVKKVDKSKYKKSKRDYQAGYIDGFSKATMEILIEELEKRVQSI